MTDTATGAQTDTSELGNALAAAMATPDWASLGRDQKKALLQEAISKARTTSAPKPAAAAEPAKLEKDYKSAAETLFAPEVLAAVKAAGPAAQIPTSIPSPTAEAEKIEEAFNDAAAPVVKAPVVDRALTASGFTREQEQILIANLRKFWTGTQQELEQRLAEQGLVTDKQQEATKESNVVPLVKSRVWAKTPPDAATPGAIDPKEYSTNGLFVNSGLSLQDTIELNDALRTSAGAMAVPVEEFSGIATSLLKSAQQVSAIRTKPEPEQELWHRSQQYEAVQLAKGAPYDFLVNAASLAYGRIPLGTRAKLLERGAFDSAETMVRLAQRGWQLLMREQQRVAEAK